MKSIVCKSRQVPCALLPRVEMKIKTLINQGILEPIDNPKWAMPIVLVVKSNGEIRICGDYKQTLIKVLPQNTYPAPAIQDLLASVGRVKIFTKLDLVQAYQQLVVDGRTAETQTLVTHLGLFKVNRLQFGFSLAPQIFQKVTDTKLQGINEEDLPENLEKSIGLASSEYGGQSAV